MADKNRSRRDKVIPGRLRKVRLGELFRERRESGRSGLPTMSVTMAEGIIDRESLDRRVLSDLRPEQHLLARKGDIAYNMMRMWQGVSGLVPYDCVVSPAYVVLEPLDGIVPDFAAYFLKNETIIRRLHRFSQGLTGDRLRLYYEQFKDIPVEIPDTETQSVAAQILTAIDRTFEATRAVIEQTRRLKSALLQLLLTKGIPGIHRSFRSIYRIGKIPADWSDARLGEVAEVIQGVAIDPSRTPKAQPTPYLRVANVQQGTIDLTEVKEIETSISERQHLGLRVSDVLMVEGHANIEELGRAALVPKAAEGMIFQNHLFRVRPDFDRLDPRFLAMWINSHPGRRYFKIFGGTTSGLNTVGSGQIRSLRLPIPAIKEQHAICDILESLDSRVQSAESDLDQLTRVKTALSQDLLTGRIPIARKQLQ